jgi:hypothetical protein
MNRTRLLGLTTVSVIVAWLATAAMGFVLLLSALSGWCSDDATQAECASQQHSADVTAIVLGLLGLAIAVALTYAVVRGLSRPTIERRRWYLGAAVGILAMPLGVIAGALIAYDTLGHTPGGREAAIATAILIQLAWPLAWALALDRITVREALGAPATGP